MPYLRDIGAYQQSACRLFEKIFPPETSTPQSGIYQCAACGFEIVAGRGTPLPSMEDCSRHNDRWKCKPGQVSWRLVAIPIDTNG